MSNCYDANYKIRRLEWTGNIKDRFDGMKAKTPFGCYFISMFDMNDDIYCGFSPVSDDEGDSIEFIVNNVKEGKLFAEKTLVEHDNGGINKTGLKHEILFQH